MRARMSDGAARSSYVFTGGDAHVYCAEVEARAILAETEPVPSLADWTMALPVGCLFPSPMASALAESLRSFVEGC